MLWVFYNYVCSQLQRVAGHLDKEPGARWQQEGPLEVWSRGTCTRGADSAACTPSETLASTSSHLLRLLLVATVPELRGSGCTSPASATQAHGVLLPASDFLQELQPWGIPPVSMTSS